MRSLAALFSLFFLSPPILAQTTLEAPNEGQTVTGIGLVRGWACEAQDATLAVDGGPPIHLATGGPRNDTRAACGRSDTGFSLLLNWNEYGAGEHTLELSIDGRLVISRTVTVLTYGEGFIAGLSGEWTLEDWPYFNYDTTVAWNEATQNIEIVDIIRPQDSQGVSSLEPLLGSWMFEYQPSTFNPPPELITMTEINGNQADGHLTGLEWMKAVGRKNDTRWRGRPLFQYEIYWTGRYTGVKDNITRRHCMMYVFDLQEDGPVTRARGYRWSGTGETLRECEQAGTKTFPATGVRRSR